MKRLINKASDERKDTSSLAGYLLGTLPSVRPSNILGFIFRPDQNSVLTELGTRTLPDVM